ncbi:MAG: DegT/DnrJ/EryC1/StrS family aminotransferase [bacterium]
MIPILDLKRQYNSMKTEIDKAVIDVLESGCFVLGPNVKELEKDIATYCNTKHAVSLASGTDAIHLALRALDIGVGDEVITVSFTFVATTEAISLVGATPVFVDVDEKTFNIDYKEIEKKITPKTKAIMPVHLYGQPCDMDIILEIAKKYNLAVIEDCCQAIGAEYKGKKVGSFGEIGCFSFFPTKNLGAYGDGGIITTNSDFIADRMLALRNHGGKVRYYHDEVGTNSRLDEMQAAILRVKLPHIDKWNNQRKEAADYYNNLFAGVEGVETPYELDETSCVYHQYTLKVKNRDALHKYLNENGVMAMIYYPVPLHLQKLHENLGIKKGELPVTEDLNLKVLSLPIFPELTRDEQNTVAQTLIKGLAELKATV